MIFVGNVIIVFGEVGGFWIRDEGLVRKGVV